LVTAPVVRSGVASHCQRQSSNVTLFELRDAGKWQADMAVYVGPEASEEDALRFLEDIADSIREEGIWRTSPKYPEECPF